MRMYCLLVAVLAPAASFAHPGHGVSDDGWSLLHFLTEPDHLAAAIGVLIIAAAILLVRKGLSRV